VPLIFKGATEDTECTEGSDCF